MRTDRVEAGFHRHRHLHFAQDHDRRRHDQTA
jgi:hypothetical protein